MANWLNQLQSLLGQQGNPVSAEKSSSAKNLLPGALGGLAGLLVASKSSRKLLAKYGTGALLVGGGAVAGSVLWNKYQQKNARPAGRYRDTDINSVYPGTGCARCAQRAADYRVSLRRQKRRSY